jgi:hypothetical protein
MNLACNRLVTSRRFLPANPASAADPRQHYMSARFTRVSTDDRIGPNLTEHAIQTPLESRRQISIYLHTPRSFLIQIDARDEASRAQWLALRPFRHTQAAGHVARAPQWS